MGTFTILYHTTRADLDVMYPPVRTPDGMFTLDKLAHILKKLCASHFDIDVRCQGCTRLFGDTKCPTQPGFHCTHCFAVLFGGLNEAYRSGIDYTYMLNGLSYTIPASFMLLALEAVEGHVFIGKTAIDKFVLGIDCVPQTYYV